MEFLAITPEEFQAWMNVDVGMGFTIGGLIVVALASFFGLPLLHKPTRNWAMEKTGLKKKDETNSEK